MLLFGVLAGWLCVGGGCRIAGGMGWMASWMAVGMAVCEWLLAHWSVGGADGVFVGSLGGYVRVVACTLRGGRSAWLVVGCGSGCFLRLLGFGSVGWLVMCERLVAHCGGCGVDAALDGGLGCYV